MKYDLKRLREAIDGQIPEIYPDIELLHQAVQRTGRRKPPQTARVLTAAAACILMLLVMGSLFAPGMQVRPDDTGDGRFTLSQGSTAFPQASAVPQANQSAIAVVWEEDMENYQPYSPLFAKNVFPEEATFGDVVIRKIEQGYEKVFAFYDRVTDERIFEGENLWFYGQAFAYFPATDTALVGNGDGMALVARDGRMVTEYRYSHFEYLGGGIAIVSENGEDDTVPSPMYVASTADGSPLSGEYAIVGTLQTGERRFLKGYFDYDLQYEFDLMKEDGSLIARLSEFHGVYYGDLLGVVLPGETDYCLMDTEGNVQMNGLRFSRLMGEKDGLIIARPVNQGWGVISRTGEWIFEPGEYSYVEMGPEDTFIVTDKKTLERRQVNAQGEDVTSTGMRIRWAIDQAEEEFIDWLASFGRLGRAVLVALAGYLIIRLVHARSEGELRRMLATELGWAVYAAALMLFSHRESWNDMQLWPTVTTTDGAYAAAFRFALAAYGWMASALAVFPWLRKSIRAFWVGAAALLIPWMWKMFAADMSVADWRTASALVFLWHPVLILLRAKSGIVRRYIDWCASLDAQSEYSRGWRMVWYVLTAAALINFCAGCWLSGQTFYSCTHQADVQRGMVSSFDEEWIDGVNGLYGEYVLAGQPEELLDEKAAEDWSKAAAVRWMDEQGINEFRAGMLVSVTLKAELQLARKAEPGIYLTGGSDSVPMIGFMSGVSDGGFGCTGVWLLPPNSELPAITGGIRVQQPENEWIASQHVWNIDMGQVAGGSGDGTENVGTGTI